MKIAILGWGSLIWDERPEFDKQHLAWQEDGPELQLEFSRVSSSRSGALTLVIDEDNGAECQVAYAMSRRNSPDDAICDLRCREGTILKWIGYYFRDESRCGEPTIPETIMSWATEKQIDVVVWTGLASNFEEGGRPEFSVENALAYLQKLSPEVKAKAAEYAWRAPEFIKTPLRTALEREPWFRPPS